MKWVVLIGLIFFCGFLTSVLRSKPKLLPHAAFVLALSPFIEAKFHLLSSPISWPAWPDVSKGIEVSIMDAVAFAMVLACRPAKSPASLRISLALVIVAYLVSTIASGAELETYFIGWEIIRAVVVYMAVTRACATNPSSAEALFNGLVAGISIQAVVAASQYATGTAQAAGWMAHQNMLGYSLHFVLYPAVALLLGGFCRKRALLTICASLLCAFTGASRATIGLTLAGILITAIVSSWHHVSGRKMGLIGGAFLALLVISPVMYSALGRRTEEQQANSSLARDLMEAAATMIIDDNPLGVGANRYVLVANMGGYSERAGVPWDPGSRGAPVHNSYYLVTAELGWLGLFAFISLLGSAIRLAIRVLRRAPHSFGGEFAAGSVVTFVLVSVHCYFEWIFMEHYGHAFFALSLGAVAGLNAVLRQTSVPPLQRVAHGHPTTPSQIPALQ